MVNTRSNDLNAEAWVRRALERIEGSTQNLSRDQIVAALIPSIKEVVSAKSHQLAWFFKNDNTPGARDWESNAVATWILGQSDNIPKPSEEGGICK